MILIVGAVFNRDLLGLAYIYIEVSYAVSGFSDLIS
jgi:hypothetical protein